MENNQCCNTLYKPHVGYHQCISATAASIQQSNYFIANNGPHTTNCTSSSLLSPYPLISDSNCSTWQETCPTDYLGLPTFDPKQQTSPSASPLSSSSSTSLDMAVHSSAEDFYVGDLLDTYAQHQSQVTSPALTDSMMTTTHLNYPTYFTPSSIHPPPLQMVSPNTEYWISPETPLMESMDGLMTTTNPIGTMDYHHYQQQQPYFFTKQEDDTTTSSAFMFGMATPIHHNNEPAAHLGNKKRAKKVHHCPHCQHTSNRANNMKEHILTHDPYRPKLFACDICQKSFARKHDMKRHTKSHLRTSRKHSKTLHYHPHPHYQV